MTTPVPQPAWMPYGEARDLLNRHPIRMSEIPVESYISLPMPTRRWPQAVWASFAAPAVRQPGQRSVAPPDRWWAIDARTGRLASFAHTSIVPLDATSASSSDDLIGMKPETRSVDEQKSDLIRMAKALDLVTDHFFEGRTAPASNRREAEAALRKAIPEQLMPFYRAMAFDFFDWLAAP
jgi:hypothetical protein